METYIVYSLIVIFFIGLIIGVLTIIPSETEPTVQQVDTNTAILEQHGSNGEKVISYVFLVALIIVLIAIAIIDKKSSVQAQSSTE